MKKQESGNQKNMKKTTLPYLNDYIKKNIFCRIPADLLHKNFKVLSKQWWKIISSTSFIDAQILHSKPGFLQIVQTKDGNHHMRFWELEGEGNNKVSFLNKIPKRLPYRTCNGLILLEHLESDVYSIVNPTINETISFPRCKQKCSHHVRMILIDFVFVPSTKKYKLVTRCTEKVSDSKYFTIFHILTLGKDGFREEAPRYVEEPNLNLYEFGYDVLVNEILYMNVTGKSGKQKLLSFDVGNEETIRLMEYPFTAEHLNPPLIHMGDFLSAVCRYCSGHSVIYDFWILKDASKEEWVMKNRIERCTLPRLATSLDAYVYRVVESLNNGETVLFYDGNRSNFVYDVKTENWKKIEIPHDKDVAVEYSFTRHCHLNTLVSPYSLIQ